jgi:chromosome segregation ATPase
MDAAKWAERTVERLDKEQEKGSAFYSPSKDKDMDTIEAQLAAALEVASAKDTEVTEARAAVEKVAAENIELAAKVTALEATLAALNAEKATLAAQVEAAAATAVSASEEAAEIAASVGVAPVESAPAVAPKADVLEQYLSLSGAERAAFFAANKNAIMGALRK